MHTSPVTSFHAPHSRSSITRAMLEELGAPFDLVTLDLQRNEQRSGEYLAINPMGKVPALRHEGALIAGLKQGPWLLGDRFTAADVLWGGALNFGLMMKLVPDWPVFREYAERVQSRPAVRRASELDEALAAEQARQGDELAVDA